MQYNQVNQDPGAFQRQGATMYDISAPTSSTTYDSAVQSFDNFYKVDQQIGKYNINSLQCFPNFSMKKT